MSITRLNLGSLALAVSVSALAMTGSALAQGQPEFMGMHRPPMEQAMGPRGDHGRWWDDQHTVDKYKLTDAQRKSMDDIYQQHRLTLVDLHATLDKEELRMQPLIQADQPDEKAVLAQIDKVAQARAELEKANARMLLGIRRQLTPDQWKQVQADWATRRDASMAPPQGRGNGQGNNWRGGQNGPGGNGQGGRNMPRPGPGNGPGAGPAGSAAPPPPPAPGFE